VYIAAAPALDSEFNTPNSVTRISNSITTPEAIFDLICALVLLVECTGESAKAHISNSFRKLALCDSKALICIHAAHMLPHKTANLK
jgi:hypothetical protein